MRALITGANGTVGSMLRRRLQEAGGEAIGWDRGRAVPGHWDHSQALVEELAPEAIFHTAVPSSPVGLENEGWLVNEKWTADLSALARDHEIPFVYTSTVLVFTNRASGPFSPAKEPDETEGYGWGKLLGERAAFASGPNARVARLGWQIGRSVGSNNMFHHLQKQQDETGRVRASSRWLPATSFLEDTADALLRIALLPPGLYHVDGNTRWNFHEIVVALNEAHGRPWTVEATEDFVYDQRMSDPRVEMPALNERLAGLA